MTLYHVQKQALYFLCHVSIFRLIFNANNDKFMKFPNERLYKMMVYAVEYKENKCAIIIYQKTGSE